MSKIILSLNIKFHSKLLQLKTNAHASEMGVDGSFW